MTSLTNQSHLQPPTTPALVFDEPKLDLFVGRFEEALAKHWPNSVLSYSFKTNALPWLLAYMRDRGVWAEVVSDTEYALATTLGYGPEQVVFNGPIKGREQLRSALRNGSVVNLDAKREVAWVAELAFEQPETQFAVGLRVNWDLNAYCPGESHSGQAASRFGFNPENGELDQAIAALTEAGVRVAGLHMHRNSYTQSVDVFRASATVAKELITSRGLNLDWLDIGGGFFGAEHGSPTFEDYVLVIKETLAGVVDPEYTRLIVEPGASLVAVPLEFHAGVLDVKEINGTTFVVTDASRTNIDPMFRRKRPFEYRLETKETVRRAVQTIGGYTCMEDDRLMDLRNEPALQLGDRVIFYKVGGYTMCYQAMFFSEFPPPVYVRTTDDLMQVRGQPTVEDYLAHHWWSPASTPGIQRAATVSGS